MEMEDPFSRGVGLPPDRLPLLVHEAEEATDTLSASTISLADNHIFTLSWKNLSVWVKKKRKESFLNCFPSYEDTKILNNVNGFVRSGSLVAIMGASHKTEKNKFSSLFFGHMKALICFSGAGKTTLLAKISQRIKGDSTGEILLNGQKVSKEVMRRISGFVPQQDLAVETLTVVETLSFMSRLKMDPLLKEMDRRKWIRSLLTELGLNKCINTRLSALSGGERKRLSLAVQLLTDPPILFCDEPTTGLDSYSAGAVVEKLKQLSSTGKAIICTIHQPASGIFDLFHRVLLLAGGRLAYLGDVADAPSYFKGLGLECPSAYNPAEFYVQQLSVVPGREEECLKRIDILCDHFALSSQGMALQTKLSTISSSIPHEDDCFSAYSNMQRPKIPCLTQLYWLTWRTFTDERRQWSTHLVRLGLFMMNQSTKKSQVKKSFTLTGMMISGLLRYKGLFYLVVTETIFTYSYAVQNTFPGEMPILLREISDGLYPPGPYYLSKMVTLFVSMVLAFPFMDIKYDQHGIQSTQGLLYLVVTETIFTYSYAVQNTFPGEMPILLREISDGLYPPGPYYLSKMVTLLPKSILEPIPYALLIFYVVGLTGGFSGFVLFCVPVILCATSSTAYGAMLSASFDSISSSTLLSVPIDLVCITFSGIYMHLSTLPEYLSWIRYVSQFYYANEAISIFQWRQVSDIECSDDPALPCFHTGDEVLDNYGFAEDNLPIDILGLTLIYVFAHIVGFARFCMRSKSQPTY